jgi:hypothetical protein
MTHAFNGFCCNCGAGLKYPVELVYRNRKTGEVVKTETWGRDCFETKFGDGSKFLRNGQFDVEEYAAAKLAREEAAAAATAEFEARKAQYAVRNAPIIEALKPFGSEVSWDQWKGVQYGALLDNFAGSIIRSLQNGELAVDLPDRAKSIIIDIVAKGEGRRGSKKYDAKALELEEILFPEVVA